MARKRGRERDRQAVKYRENRGKKIVRENKFNLCIFDDSARCDDLYANEIGNYLFCYSKYIIIVIKLQYSIHLSKICILSATNAAIL